MTSILDELAGHMQVTGERLAIGGWKLIGDKDDKCFIILFLALTSLCGRLALSR
jgi:hypothetical protein